jgi:hypothetical protein
MRDGGFLDNLLWFILIPPVMACAWWILSRGWAKGIQGPQVSDRTKKREKLGFWVLLILLYIVSFGMLVYARFTLH